MAPLPRYKALFLWLMIQVSAILQSQHPLVLTESATSAQVLNPCPHPGGCLVISSASRCLYWLLFLIVKHICQVPVGGKKKKGEINESPQLQQGHLLKERKGKLSASAVRVILLTCYHLLKTPADCESDFGTFLQLPFSHPLSWWRSPLWPDFPQMKPPCLESYLILSAPTPWLLRDCLARLIK